MIQRSVPHLCYRRYSAHSCSRTAPRRHTGPAERRRFEEMIAAAAEHHGLRTEFLYKRAWEESRLNPDAEDGHGDYGLMQLAERWFPGASTMSAETNLDLGAAYLGAGNLRRAVAMRLVHTGPIGRVIREQALVSHQDPFLRFGRLDGRIPCRGLRMV